MSRTLRRRLVSATTLLTVLVTLCLVPQASVLPAAAPRPRPPPSPHPPPSVSRRSSSTAASPWASRSNWPSLPDGKVFYINRGTSPPVAQVRLYNPATQSTTVALTLRWTPASRTA